MKDGRFVVCKECHESTDPEFGEMVCIECFNEMQKRLLGRIRALEDKVEELSDFHAKE